MKTSFIRALFVLNSTPMQLLTALLTLIAWLLVIATAASWLANYHWVFDTVANLRIQGLLVITILLIVTLLLRQWHLTVASTALLLINLSMLNFGDLDSRATRSPVNPIRIVTTNVYARNSHHDAIIEELRQLDADVMVVIELTPPLARRLEAAFGRSHPHISFEDSEFDNFGIGLLSRKPIDAIEVLRWEGSTISLQAIIGQYRLIATHPVPPIGTPHFNRRNQQLTQLAEHIRPAPDNLANAPRPQRTILLGDLNLTPWNPHFTNLVARSGLRRTGPCWDFRPTWYGRPGFLFGLKIDHVLISDDLVGTKYAIGDEHGSDHRSVTVTIDQIIKPAIAPVMQHASNPPNIARKPNPASSSLRRGASPPIPPT